VAYVIMIRDIDSNSFEMSQPFLICWILEFLSLDKHKTKGCNTLVGKPLLIVILIEYLAIILGFIVVLLVCFAI
jgi:hypothetical protein